MRKGVSVSFNLGHIGVPAEAGAEASASAAKDKDETAGETAAEAGGAGGEGAVAAADEREPARLLINSKRLREADIRQRQRQVAHDGNSN